MSGKDAFESGVTRREFPLRAEQGDQARVLEDVTLEGGAVLRRNQNVVVSSTAPDNPFVGVRWRDDDGTHVMALERDKLEVVL